MSEAEEACPERPWACGPPKGMKNHSRVILSGGGASPSESKDIFLPNYLAPRPAQHHPAIAPRMMYHSSEFSVANVFRQSVTEGACPERSRRVVADINNGHQEKSWCPFPFARMPAECYKQTMEKVITTYASFEAMKADELREWQALPAYERMRAVSQITAALYAIKEPPQHVRRVQRTLVWLQRSER